MSNTLSTVQMAQLDITCLAGDTLPQEFDFLDDDGVTPINLSGYTILMQIKKTQLGTPVMSITPVLSGAGNNKLTIKSIINLKGGNYFYDMEFTSLSDGSVVTYLGGKLIVQQDTTNSTKEK